jgi:hypothetical protein
MGFLFAQLDILVLHLATDEECGLVASSSQADGAEVQTTLIKPSNSHKLKYVNKLYIL